MAYENRQPIVFLLGPSGSGKTTLGRWLAEDLRFLHLEIDRWPEGDGIDLAGLRAEWDAFLGSGQADNLAAAIRDRVSEAGRRGAVLSFSSMLLLDPDLIRAAERHGIRAFVLYGTAADCMQAFLNREQATGRGLDQEHWRRNNTHTYIAYSGTEFAPDRLEAFSSGIPRGRHDLVAEVQRKVAG